MKKQFLFLILLAACSAVFAQSELKVFPDWATTDGSQNFFYKNVTKTDGSNNIYIAGATTNGNGDYDILVAKYNSSGTQLWLQQYNGAGNANDMATGLYIDGSGNVYITGTVTTATNIDIVTIKYNNIGTQQWLSTFNGSGSSIDCGADVTVDGSGNVYIAGSSMNASGNYDVITIKYNNSGAQQWATPYDYTAHLDDAGAKIAMDVTGKVVVSCVVKSTATTYKYGVLKYNSSTGALASGSLGGTSSTGINQVSDMVQDASGNIYLAGATPVTGQGYNYDIIKLNSSLGVVWESTYNGGSSLDDIAKGIAVDASGNVYATGYSTSSSEGKNIVTVKFNSSGTQQWVHTYNDDLDGDDEANAMALDVSGNIYITGYTSTEIDYADYYIAKYDASGNELWSIHSDAPSHLNDKATNIVIDNNGDIVITGQSETDSSVYAYYTIKYVERQIITPADYENEEPNNSLLYYRNDGQLLATDSTLVPTIKYYTNNSSPEFYIKKNSFSFVFAHTDTSASTNDTLHRIDATFEEVNSNAKTYAMEEQPSYLNYFLPQCPKGITEVHGSQRLITYELYPYIDLMYCSNQDGIKYYFIVKPGGDPSRIKMDFTGVSSFNLDGSTNALTVNSSIGNITFERPTAYQLTANNEVDTITAWQCAWQTNGASNKYKFYAGSYNTSLPLIIQVDKGHSSFTLTANGNLDWCTYAGGNLNDEFNDIKTDKKGKVYVTGYSQSQTLFPISSGVQPTNHGYSDVVILKFDSLGARKWVTFYGGNLGDIGNSIVTDNAGYVYVTGSTTSTDFPLDTLGGAFMQYNLVGGGDAFIIKLDSTGHHEYINSHTWTTYFGGSGGETGYELKLDSQNNLYLVGKGDANSHITSQSGSYNNSANGTGLIAKFNPQDTIIWCSLYAGTEKIKSLVIDNDDAVFITGSATNSIYLPLVKHDAFSYCDSTFNGGTSDIFIAKLDNNDTIIWSTYYGGGVDDDVNAMAIDKGGSVFLTGTTTSGNFPIFHTGVAYYDNLKEGSNDIFICKFGHRSSNEVGEQLWSTYFGGDGTFEDGFDIAVDDTGNVYVTGDTYSDNLPYLIPANAFADGYMNPNSTSDAFLIAFKPNLYRIWTTLFGKSFNDCAYGIATYKNSRLYLTGYSDAHDYTSFWIEDPGTAWMQQINNGFGYTEGFIARFYISPIIAATDIDEPEMIDNLIMNVYPNPANGNITLEVPLEDNENLDISVYNMMGIKVYGETVFNAYGLYTKNFDFTGFGSGVYIIQIKTKDKVASKKIIKQY
jgi:uncharacterized delta-60 repeat protein